MTRHVHSARVAAAATAAGVVAALVAGTPAWAQDDPVVLSVGHVDALSVHLEDGDLILRVKDDTQPPPVFREVEDVIFQVLPEAEQAVPADERYAFLGDPGNPVWILPQTQDPNLLWPGWSTEQLSAGTLAGNQVTVTLESVDGPGMVSVFNVDPFGNPVIRWHAEGGTVNPDSLVVPINTHAHGAWAFDAEGTYTLTFRADATLAEGGQVSTGPVDYTFVVGELPDGQPDIDLTIAGMQPSYGPGDTVELTAVQNPQTDEDHYHWYSLCPGGDDFEVVPDELDDTYSFTAESELDGCQYLARLFDDDHDVIAASPPVTLNVSDSGGGPGDPELSQSIIATIDEMDGALVVSVDPDDRTVIMSVAELTDAGDRLASTGELRPVTVTDTRPGAPGWNVSGQVGDFTGDAGEFAGSLLGWAPEVLSQANGQGVVAGDAVPTGFDSGDGLAVSRILGSAGSGDGLGTAQLGAGLTLELPTQTPAGEYTATLTLTAI